LKTLGLQLDQLEQAGGEAGRVRRLPDRARWAVLALEAASPASRPAAADYFERVRLHLRETLNPRPGQIRLARALARMDAALLQGAPGHQACERAREDLGLLHELIRIDPLVTEVWRAAARCAQDKSSEPVGKARKSAASSP
jgi:hypothetical protein